MNNPSRPFCIYSYLGEVPAPQNGCIGGLLPLPPPASSPALTRPPIDEFNPAVATASERTCRTIPLEHVHLLDEVIFPSTSKNSLRLAYFTQYRPPGPRAARPPADARSPQYLALCFPQHPSTEKFKISAPARFCRIDRVSNTLLVHMRLAHVQFSKAAPDAAAQYYDEPHLRAWARATHGGKGPTAQNPAPTRARARRRTAALQPERQPARRRIDPAR